MLRGEDWREKDAEDWRGKDEGFAQRFLIPIFIMFLLWFVVIGQTEEDPKLT